MHLNRIVGYVGHTCKRILFLDQLEDIKKQKIKRALLARLIAGGSDSDVLNTLFDPGHRLFSDFMAYLSTHRLTNIKPLYEFLFDVQLNLALLENPDEELEDAVDAAIYLWDQYLSPPYHNRLNDGNAFRLTISEILKSDIDSVVKTIETPASNQHCLEALNTFNGLLKLVFTQTLKEAIEPAAVLQEKNRNLLKSFLAS